MKYMKAHKPDVAVVREQVEETFVGLWRSMSSLWGISPTMAEIHGLLYITGAALSMDDIMARLGISRGNVSMNLSKLDRKSTRLNSSHANISYAVFCLKKKQTSADYAGAGRESQSA